MADNGGPLILLTRPRAQADRFAAALAGLAEIRVEPLLEIVFRDPPEKTDACTGFLFTSENGVTGAACAGNGRIAYCVGPRTAAAAAALGFAAVDCGGTADHVVDRVLRDSPKGRLCHMRGAHARGNIVARLAEAGLTARDHIVYDQIACNPSEPLAGLAEGRPVFAPLFSPRSARLFAAEIGGATGHWTILCLSQAVRDALPSALWQRAEIVEEPTANAIKSALKRHISP